MSERRKAEVTGMQDPLYPRELPDGERRLQSIDPSLAFSLSAAQTEIHRRLGMQESEWQPKSIDEAFAALGLGSGEPVARRTGLR